MIGEAKPCGVIFTDKRPARVQLAFVVPYAETHPIGDGAAIVISGMEIVGELTVSPN
jgi:hypothetical protein